MLEPYLDRIESALGLDLKQAPYQRLGGLTNRNYRLDTRQGSFVLRIAGEGTAEYINRAHEEVNARIASQAGVNVEILYFDSQDGTLLSRFLPESETMSPEAFSDPGALQRAGRVLRRLHDCQASFANRFELFEQIDCYLKVLSDKNAQLPPGYAEVQAQAERVRNALGRCQLPSRPCHCDPLVENFLDDGESMRLIDFEYSGNNDPMWDLGDLAVEGGFSSQQQEHLLQGYFSGPVPPFERARMVIYQAMCDLLWTLWGVVQHVNGNPADDFWIYSLGRLERCRRLMQSANFAEQLELLEAQSVLNPN
ncbi:phosphotransferase family protein [bacterium]|nr:phosphotransferase family protein [bacterium]